MQNYYETLGIKKTASPDEIKRAYRSLAHKYHPDKANGDRAEQEAKFKQINEAYQVLSDPDKRARYDQFGTAGVNSQGFGGQDPFGEQNPFGQGGFQFDFGGGNRGGFGGFGSILEDMIGSAFANVQAECHITLTQAILGATINLRFDDESIELKIPAGTRDGQGFLFRGKGHQHKRGRGDLTIVVRIDLPRRLSREQKELFEKLRETGL